MMYNISFYFILFLIYSIIGWILEIITVFIETKKIINRGFMLGPYCPIYGYSSIIMIFLQALPALMLKPNLSKICTAAVAVR